MIDTKVLEIIIEDNTFDPHKNLIRNTDTGKPLAIYELEALFATEIDRHVRGAEAQHVEIYKWLLGYHDFPASEPGKRYNWRAELRAKLPEHIKAQLAEGKEQSDG